MPVSRRVVLGAALLPLGMRRAFAAEQPVVAAAADVADVLPKVVAAFTAATGQSVKVSLGSSGNLTKQIQQGAPFEMFMSADESFVEALAKEGKTEGDGVLYAIGHVGLYVPEGSPLKADGSLGDLAAALKDGRLQKLAIANPEFAPYGRAARAALQHAGLWEAIQPHLVLGENVGQAMQFASSGSTQGGLVPLTLAKTPAMAAKGQFALVPDGWYPPLRQKMVLIKGAGRVAQAFYAYVQSAPARALLKAAGFVLPGES